MSNIQMAKALGWTSLAVGATEFAATRWLQEQMGVDGHETLIRAFGAREVAAGVAILNQPGITNQLAVGLWARVAGDAVDLALLSAATATTRNSKGLGVILGIVLAVTGLDILVASRVQGDLVQGKAKATAARQRVRPTAAAPNGAVSLTSQTPALASQS